jgi:hypothetical protein
LCPAAKKRTVKKEKKEVTHDWFVMTPDGKQHDYKEYLDDTPFGCLVKKELGCCSPGRWRPGPRGPDALKGARGL